MLLRAQCGHNGSAVPGGDMFSHRLREVLRHVSRDNSLEGRADTLNKGLLRGGFGKAFEDGLCGAKACGISAGGKTLAEPSRQMAFKNFAAQQVAAEPEEGRKRGVIKFTMGF